MGTRIAWCLRFTRRLDGACLCVVMEAWRPHSMFTNRRRSVILSWGSLIHMPAGCSLAGEAMFPGQACREQDQLAGHMNATSILNVQIQGPGSSQYGCRPVIV